MARSPYVVPCCKSMRITGPARTHRAPHRRKTHLRQWETEGRAENNGKESQPTKAQFNTPRKAAKWFRYKRAPNSGDRLAYNRVWYIAKGDYPEETRI